MKCRASGETVDRVLYRKTGIETGFIWGLDAFLRSVAKKDRRKKAALEPLFLNGFQALLFDLGLGTQVVLVLGHFLLLQLLGNLRLHVFKLGQLRVTHVI